MVGEAEWLGRGGDLGWVAGGSSDVGGRAVDLLASGRTSAQEECEKGGGHGKASDTNMEQWRNAHLIEHLIEHLR